MELDISLRHAMIVNSVKGLMPELPEVSNKDLLRLVNLSRFSFIPSLLIRSSKGELHFFDSSMNESFWSRWWKHKDLGLFCFVFYTLFYQAYPIVWGRNFFITSFSFRGNIIHAINLQCTKCNKITYVDSTWFYRLLSDPRPLICCHKRLVYQPHWKLFFWGMYSYNLLKEDLAHHGYQFWLTVQQDKSWATSCPNRNQIVREFSLLSSRELKSGN